MRSVLVPHDALEQGWMLRPSRGSVLVAVVKRMIPYLIEATVIPSVLFYLLLGAFDLRWALVGAMVYAYTAVLRRLVVRQAVPGLILLAALGISTRTVIFLLSGNEFVYFVQPILRTVLTAVLFAVSVLAGRPLIGRFAADFCPLAPEVKCRPGVMQLFRRLTFLWAGVNAAAAAVSLALLLTVPVAVFVATATISAWVITGSGVVLTISAAFRTARTEGLATAVAPNGTLYAYVAA